MSSMKPLFTLNATTIWKIAVYIRLSREDGNDESLSVTNQRKIILDYLEHTFEGQYVVVDNYVDDGKTGTDYDRKDFQRMLADIEAGKVNCVVCKTLSRAFRNYADQGYFLESYFPRHGIRFISVDNPVVDSFLNPKAVYEGLEIPINGLLNDRYAGKTSADIRRTFDTKRRNGEFIGAFAPYGYSKSPTDKNSLVIDQEAAQVVQDIFHWFTVEGMSKNGIAKRLNELGVPNPTQYKKQKGLQYSNPHAIENDGLWCLSVISKILNNQVYIGNMVQGRQKVISYKVHDRISLPENQWYVVENTHEAIINKNTFDLAQSLQQRHMRTAPYKYEHHLLSGFVYCADCHKALRRKSSKQFIYYACRTYTDQDKSRCSKHSIRADKLENAVLVTIQKQIELVENLSHIIDEINQVPFICTKSKRLENMIGQQKNELFKTTRFLDHLYIDWKSGEITREQYNRMREQYTAQAEQLEQRVQSLQDEISMMEQGITNDNPYLEAFLKYRNIQSLDRGILVELVKNIYVHEDKSITIEFNFADEYQRILDVIEANQQGQ